MAVLDNTISPRTEGINGLTISNAIHLSSWLDDGRDLPFDEDKFHDILQGKIKSSTVIEEDRDGVIDLKGSH